MSASLGVPVSLQKEVAQNDHAARLPQGQAGVDVNEQKLGWRIHATVHGVVMTGLIVLNLLIINLTTENFLGSSSR